MKDLLRIVEDANWEFEQQRPQLRDRGNTFHNYLPPFVERCTAAHPELRFPLLAKLAQSDLQLSLQAGETVIANDYFAAFPELAASPAVINDLLRTEAKARCGGDNLRLWQFDQGLSEIQRALFNAEGIVPRYQLLSKIGSGGQAEVWLATDSELNRQVAVKIPLRQELHQLQTFFHEAQLTARFQHPAIVPVYGLARTTDGKLCYAMQRLELTQLKQSIEQYHDQTVQDDAARNAEAPTVLSGETAAADSQPTQAIRAVSANPEHKRRDLLRMIGQLIVASRAVAYAHQQKILHLDLKPENILVGDFGETMVVDWGLAKSQEEALAGAGGATIRYMSPEVARRWLGQSSESPTPQTDVYGLGAMLYHVLTGRSPFAFGEDEFSQPLAAGADYRSRCIARVANELPQSVRRVNPQVDRVLAAICHKAMAPNLEQRYATAEEFAVELEKWQSGEETEAYPFSLIEKLYRWANRNRRLLARGSVVVAILLLAAWYGWLSLKHRDVALLVDQLPTVTADGLVAQIEQIHARPRSAQSLLQERLQAIDQQDPAQVRSEWRYRLALLPYDKQQVVPLLQALQHLQSAEEFDVLSRELFRATREALPPEAREHLAVIAQGLSADQPDNRARLRIVATLAAFDPQRDWSDEERRQIAGDLARADPDWLAVCNRWIRRSPECEQQIAEALQALALGSKSSIEEANQAAAILAQWRANDPPALLELLQPATLTQLPLIVDVVRAFQRHVEAELRQQESAALQRLHSSPPAKSAAEHGELDKRAAAAANLLLAHWSIAPGDFKEALLQPAADPRLRTELIHRLRHARIPALQVVNWLRASSVTPTRSGLLLALARYPSTDLADEARRKLLTELATAKDVADPEFVSALEHLHRQWNVPIPRRPAEAPNPATPGWQWTTGHQTAINHRLVTVPLHVASTPTVLGASGEGHSDEPERPRPVTIPRSFAIATTEVTRAQFREFLTVKLSNLNDRTAKAKIKELIDDKVIRFELQEDSPVFDISMSLAAAYCNWLSSRENLDCCYPDGVMALALSHLREDFPALDRELLNGNGYRLPTEEEWELACRAGTTTPRHYGYREAYLSDYAMYRFNSRLGPRRVAHGPPNAWGLFDMHGNLAEWCHTTESADIRDGTPVTDEGPFRIFKDEENMSKLRMRGCAHQNVPDVVRSAYRSPLQPWNEMHPDVGFRIVRTLSRKEEKTP